MHQSPRKTFWPPQASPCTASIVIGTRYVMVSCNSWMTLWKGVVSGLSGTSAGISFRQSQSNWYRKLPKQLQKMNKLATSLTTLISDNLPSGTHSHKARENGYLLSRQNFMLYSKLSSLHWEHGGFLVSE